MAFSCPCGELGCCCMFFFGCLCWAGFQFSQNGFSVSRSEMQNVQSSWGTRCKITEGDERSPFKPKVNSVKLSVGSKDPFKVPANEIHCPVTIEYDNDGSPSTVSGSVFAGYDFTQAKNELQLCKSLFATGWPNMGIESPTLETSHTSPTSGIESPMLGSWYCGNLGDVICTDRSNCVHKFGNSILDDGFSGSRSWLIFPNGPPCFVSAFGETQCTVDKKNQVRFGTKAQLVKAAEDNFAMVEGVHKGLQIAMFVFWGIAGCCCCWPVLSEKIRSFRDFNEEEADEESDEDSD